MRPTFFGLEIGRSGLFVSQKALDVTGHNMANVETEGYTRQRIVNTAYDPYNVIQKLRPMEQALVGAGARIMIHDQIRSKYLDRQYRTEAQYANYWSDRTTGLLYVESLFEGTLETNGFNTVFNDFLSALNIQQQNTTDMVFRTELRAAAVSLCSSMNLIHRSLAGLQSDYNARVETYTSEVNDLAVEIAELNKSIYAFEMNNGPNSTVTLIANDLRDKRNLALDKLSAIVDIEYEFAEKSNVYGEGGELKIWLGSGSGVKTPDNVLVDYKTVRQLCVAQDTNVTCPITGLELNQVVWQQGSRVVDGANNLVKDPVTGAAVPDLALTPLMDGIITGGTLRSCYDLANLNEASEKQGIPYFIEQLNLLARALVASMNEQHLQGYTHENAVGGSHTNEYFFWNGDGDIKNVDAGNIRLDDNIADAVNGIWYIAASDNKIVKPGMPGSDTGTNHGNNLNIQKMWNIWQENSMALIEYDKALLAVNSTNAGFGDNLAITNSSRLYELVGTDGSVDVSLQMRLTGSNRIKLTVTLTGTATADAIATLDLDTSLAMPPDVTDSVAMDALKTALGAKVAELLTKDVEVGGLKFNFGSDLRDYLSDPTGHVSNVVDMFADGTKEWDSGALGTISATANGDVSRRVGDQWFLGIGSLMGFLDGLIVEVATTAHHGKTMSDVNGIKLYNADQARLSLSNVSIDEEMINLVKYQHSYNGSSRVINAMDECLDVLINRTGLVGR